MIPPEIIDGVEIVRKECKVLLIPARYDPWRDHIILKKKFSKMEEDEILRHELLHRSRCQKYPLLKYIISLETVMSTLLAFVLAARIGIYPLAAVLLLPSLVGSCEEFYVMKRLNQFPDKRKVALLLILFLAIGEIILTSAFILG